MITEYVQAFIDINRGRLNYRDHSSPAIRREHAALIDMRDANQETVDYCLKQLAINVPGDLPDNRDIEDVYYAYESLWADMEDIGYNELSDAIADLEESSKAALVNGSFTSENAWVQDKIRTMITDMKKELSNK